MPLQPRQRAALYRALSATCEVGHRVLSVEEELAASGEAPQQSLVSARVLLIAAAKTLLAAAAGQEPVLATPLSKRERRSHRRAKRWRARIALAEAAGKGERNLP